MLELCEDNYTFKHKRYANRFNPKVQKYIYDVNDSRGNFADIRVNPYYKKLVEFLWNTKQYRRMKKVKI